MFLSKISRNKRKFCKKCNKKLTTDDLKKTECLGVHTTERSVDATVFLTFECTDCGELSSHALKGVTLSWVDSNGWMREHSIDEEVANYLER